MTASSAATATAAVSTVSTVVARTLNSVSMTATMDRSNSSSSDSSRVAAATTTTTTTSVATTAAAAPTVPVVWACSPVDTEEWSTKSTNQHISLQARLETKRNKQQHSPLDADGYPLCQYRKSFFGHLTVKNFITSVRFIV